MHILKVYFVINYKYNFFPLRLPMKQITCLLFIVCTTCFALGSRELDSISLLALRNANPESRIYPVPDVDPLSGWTPWLEDVPISEWEGITLDSTGRVSEINLFQKFLKVVPSEIGNFDQLTKLFLRYDSIAIIPTEIGNLKNLERLNLSSNFLESLPDEMWSLSKLTVLDVASNNISVISDEIKNLHNLSELSLVGNNLQEFPKAICSITSLQKLLLTSINLKEIPSEIGQLKNLVEFYVNYNQLNSIPAELGTLPRLATLKLDANRLDDIPESLISNDALEVSVRYNHLFSDNLTDEIVAWLNTVDWDWDRTQSQKGLDVAEFQFNSDSVFIKGNEWEYVVNHSGQYFTLKISVNEILNNNDTLTAVLKRTKLIPGNDSVMLFDSLTYSNNRIIKDGGFNNIYDAEHASNLDYDSWLTCVCFAAPYNVRVNSEYFDSTLNKPFINISKQDYVVTRSESGGCFGTYASSLYSQNVGIISRITYYYSSFGSPCLEYLLEDEIDLSLKIMLKSFNGKTLFEGKELLDIDDYKVFNSEYFIIDNANNIPRYRYQNGTLHLLQAQDVLSISMYDIKGRQILHKKDLSQESFKMTTPKLAPGIYLLKLSLKRGEHIVQLPIK